MDNPTADSSFVAGSYKRGARGRDVDSFGAIIKELRLAKKWSQASLAQQARVSTGYIGLLETGERGTRPSYEITKRLAKALTSSVEDTERLLRAGGHLGESESLWEPGDAWTVETAIRTDPRLDDEQKALILGVYRNFVGDLDRGEH